MGRRNIANSMVMGRFRYYIQSMEIPTDIVEWIDSDVQQLLWGKGDGLHAEEAGSNEAFHRWMIDGAQYTPPQQMGGGVLHWRGHVKALQAHWILRYRDATRGPWKTVLDVWLDREDEGRGAAFSTRKVSDLVSSST